MTKFAPVQAQRKGIEEGRRKKEEGRRKKEEVPCPPWGEGRRKKANAIIPRVAAIKNVLTV
ncbi:hypothetical protein [Microcoleus sp. S13_B4]|uniref:hypothetical protein n=1 Tax=Microcoleus sp. S13_B4 TaxID=3055408 RepID=UPI002FCE7B84